MSNIQGQVAVLEEKICKIAEYTESLRKTRHKHSEILQTVISKIDKNSSQITRLIEDHQDIKKVVESNTKVMEELKTAFVEANTVMKTLIRFGRFVSWFLGISLTIIAIIKFFIQQ